MNQINESVDWLIVYEWLNEQKINQVTTFMNEWMVELECVVAVSDVVVNLVLIWM